eukprot:CAMPEP_0175064024 /NCGR_PEP_ID=MMETSP0052_2-20121109/15092_1 /TAXON_ID=51329 ORGANISM="Polytomella parva, Strain SAG 63-3" /NCGR_SAMPLE_ID=MMETSP0052_2 /ASSEMBLY_ACC=CAM_ASM_000194 /LENGTH=74 /DNA_ID=CAMNT_0016330307 /DNA_START=672 /DNA_END=896 /DNA_ORIENTATION=-
MCYIVGVKVLETGRDLNGHFLKLVFGEKKVLRNSETQLSHQVPSFAQLHNNAHAMPSLDPAAFVLKDVPMLKER